MHTKEQNCHMWGPAVYKALSHVLPYLILTTILSVGFTVLLLQMKKLWFRGSLIQLHIVKELEVEVGF